MLSQQLLKNQVRRTLSRAVTARSGEAVGIRPHVACPPKVFFHSTTQLHFAVRRRRRGQKPNREQHPDDDSPAEGGSKENPLKHVPVLDNAEFSQAANELLTKLETALHPMKAKNGTFVVERCRGDLGEILTIDLGPKDGSYRMEISEEEHVFEYSSPISGKILYMLSARTGEWVGYEDGHDFEGLLVRDLIRQCQGLPIL